MIEIIFFVLPLRHSQLWLVENCLYFIPNGWQAVSGIAQIENILGFVSHMVFVKMTQLCHCGMQAAIDIL